MFASCFKSKHYYIYFQYDILGQLKIMFSEIKKISNFTPPDGFQQTWQQQHDEAGEVQLGRYADNSFNKSTAQQTPKDKTGDSTSI